MKIEKVNENQIRCTLTREDLASRELKISELAYGTEKAKSLFRDMMRQANFEFGFEAEDIPLMIEAIPLNTECVVLIITKVDDPEELDTRFSRFAPSVTEDMEAFDEAYTDSPADDVMDLFHRLQTEEPVAPSMPSALSEETEAAAADRTRIFLFTSLSRIMEVAAVLAPNYHGTSTLYKAASGNYLLQLRQGKDSPEAFDRSCNIISEYGVLQRSMMAGAAFLAEHCEVLIPQNAISLLGNQTASVS